MMNENDAALTHMITCYEWYMMSHSPLPKVDIDALPEETFRKLFRFTREDFSRLSMCLQIPVRVEVEFDYKVEGSEYLMILLRRWAYPPRYCDLGCPFGRSSPALSTLFNHALDYVYAKTEHLLRFDWERLDAP
jgi:hypothetical protein